MTEVQEETEMLGKLASLLGAVKQAAISIAGIASETPEEIDGKDALLTTAANSVSHAQSVVSEIEKDLADRAAAASSSSSAPGSPPPVDIPARPKPVAISFASDVAPADEQPKPKPVNARRKPVAATTAPVKQPPSKKAAAAKKRNADSVDAEVATVKRGKKDADAAPPSSPPPPPSSPPPEQEHIVLHLKKSKLTEPLFGSSSLVRCVIAEDGSVDVCYGTLAKKDKAKNTVKYTSDDGHIPFLPCVTCRCILGDDAYKKKFALKKPARINLTKHGVSDELIDFWLNNDLLQEAHSEHRHQTFLFQSLGISVPVCSQCYPKMWPAGSPQGKYATDFCRSCLIEFFSDDTVMQVQRTDPVSEDGAQNSEVPLCMNCYAVPHINLALKMLETHKLIAKRKMRLDEAAAAVAEPTAPHAAVFKTSTTTTDAVSSLIALATATVAVSSSSSDAQPAAAMCVDPAPAVSNDYVFSSLQQPTEHATPVALSSLENTPIAKTLPPESPVVRCSVCQLELSDIEQSNGPMCSTTKDVCVNKACFKCCPLENQDDWLCKNHAQ